MGSLFKPKTKTTQQPFETNPWGPQQGYLETGFEKAEDALNNAWGGAGAGSVAGLTPDQQKLIQQGVNSSTALGSSLNGVPQMYQGQSQQYGQQAGKATGAMVQAAGGIGGGVLDQFNQSGAMGNLSPTELGSLYQSAANQANSDEVNSLIDSSLTDVNRAFQTERGGINSAASGGGNVNSTRAGVLESRALDDAQDRAAQISSGIRMDAYNNAIQSGLANNAQNIERAATSGQLGLGAGGLQLQGQTASADAQRGVFESLNGASGSSLQNSQIAQQMQQQAQAFGLDLATIPQEQQQAIMTAAQNGQMDLVQRYMQAIGGSYGQQGYTSQTTQSASPFQQILGGGASILGGLGSFK